MARQGRRKKAAGSRAKARVTRVKRASGRSTGDSPRSGFRFHDEDVERMLSTGEEAALLRDYFGDREYEELVELASQARRKNVRGGERVLLVPGLMGSKLGRRRTFLDDVLWLDPLDIARGRIATLALPDRLTIEALGVFLLAYLKLKLRLQLSGFDVDFHPFDWRKSILVLGREFAARVKAEPARKVHVVAHSMGGLVTRAAVAHLPAGKLGRFIMLGTPNYGSFAPVQALRGQHSLAAKLATLDLVLNPLEWARDVLGTFPGLHEMLPFPEKFSGVNLFDAGAWPDRARRPRPAMLEAARRVHSALAPAGDGFFQIAGVAQQTTVGVRTDASGFVYEESDEGDGTVPLALCLLPGAKTYYVEESHGSLPNNGAVGRAVTDILTRGETSALLETWNRARSGVTRKIPETTLPPAPFGTRGPHELVASERRELLKEVVAPDAREALGAQPGVTPALGDGYKHRFENVIVTRRREHSLEINLALGSITEVKARSLVLGVFSGVEPAGAARAVDQALNGAIGEFTARRMFSARVGEVFVLPTGKNRVFADSVLFAGLGDFGTFSYDVLEFVAENVIRTFVRTNVEDFATVLVGAASGQSVEGSVRHMARGFVRGLLDADREHVVRRVTLCEIDPSSYQHIKEEIYRLLSTDLFEDVRVTLHESELPPPPVAAPSAGRPRIQPTPRTTYLYVTREGRESVHPQAGSSDNFILRASLLTAGDKAAVLSGTTVVEPRAIDALLGDFSRVSSSRTWLAERGRGVAKLLLPPEIQQGMLEYRDRPLTVVHDASASKIPWETLNLERAEERGKDSAWFPAEGAGMNRHYAAANLSVAKWLERRRLDETLDLLLVVNPTGDLGGTLDEAERIEQLAARNQGIRVTKLEGEAATRERLLREFASGNYDVIHYAGHAFFDPQAPSRSGIICHENQVLSGADLAVLPSLPALAFFNACESARTRSRGARKRATARAAPAKRVRDRIDENVGLAEAFLRGGIANYVGTYWPVGDAAAAAFAAAFYGALLAFKSVGDAVQAGRAAARSESPVDWADYVHYGSADFTLKGAGS
jgi:pimeloyl-ACP methyl ester carboxylesterase